MFAARWDKSLFLASYLRQQQAISRLRTANFLSEGYLLGSPTGNWSRLASS